MKLALMQQHLQTLKAQHQHLNAKVVSFCAEVSRSTDAAVLTFCAGVAVGAVDSGTRLTRHASCAAAVSCNDDVARASVDPQARASVDPQAPQPSGRDGERGGADAATELIKANALPLQLFEPGQNFCNALRTFCGEGGRAAAMCAKQLIQRIFPLEALVVRIRKTMDVPLEFYFLCSQVTAASVFDADAGNTERSKQLSDLLLRATHAVDKDKGRTLLDLYHTRARWSTLGTWSTAEKMAHFLTARRTHR